MKISISWLRDYIDCNLTMDEISGILTDTGLEVEGSETIETIPGGLKGLVIGEVLTVNKHENADKLNVTTVNVGTDEPLQIVCGAPNVAPNQRVVVATPGTTIHPTEGESFKIKTSKIRGVESLGMICAEDEIGLGTGHDGIMVLDNNAPIGQAAAEFFNVTDEEIIEIGLTPNRADGMSHYGVARDLAAALISKGEQAMLKMPETQNLPTNLNDFKVTVENNAACQRYAGVTLTNITVKPSPEWLQNRLRSIGLSPINNVVDITNYVNHELAQPLHAFDLSKVSGNEIVVKTGLEDKKFVTLDEVERTLHNDDLMICNANEPMCIAGVFGGLESGVSHFTTDIFLESAYFNPVSIRKTAKRHGLNTDASFRFERGIDPNITIKALERAVDLLVEHAGAQVSSNLVDIYPSPIPNHTVDFNYDRCRSLIGSDISNDTINNILSALDITIISSSDNQAKLNVPAYRVDVTREVDVIEEVLRIYGFNQVAIPEKLNSSIQYSVSPNKEAIKNKVADFFVANNMVEIMSNSLTKSAYDKLNAGVSEERHIAMLNPLSSELDVMRQTLLFSGLEAVAYNNNRRQLDLKLFEFGNVYNNYESGINEEEHLLLVFTGKEEQELWSNTTDKTSFYSAETAVIKMIQKLGLNKNMQFSESKHPALAYGLNLSVAKKKVADIGEVNAPILKAMGIKQPVFVAFVNWTNILGLLNMNRVKYKEVSKFPEMRRDLSLLIDNGVSFSDIEQTAKKQERKLLKEVSLFDVYKGKNLKEGTKSYAISLTFYDENKTLNDKQVDKVMDKITKALQTEFKAELR